MRAAVIFLSLAACFTAWGPPAMSQEPPREVRIAAGEWPPYISAAGSGIFIDIITQAYEHAGYVAHTCVLPWQRAVSKVTDGSMDVLLAVYDSPRNRQRYTLSSGLLRIDSMFAVLAGSPAGAPGPTAAHTLGVVNDSMFGPELLRRGFSRVEQAPDEDSNMKKLLTGRVDAILDTEATLLESLNRLSAVEQQGIRLLCPPFASRPVFAALLATNDRSTQLLAALEEGLAIMHRDGCYDRIRLRYGLTPNAIANLPRPPAPRRVQASGL